MVWRIVSEDSVQHILQLAFDIWRPVNDLLGVTWSFLLIVRTDQIVTASLRDGVLSDSRSFQHIARFFYVTTLVHFIVTAAVYRGFDQELCLRRG